MKNAPSTKRLLQRIKQLEIQQCTEQKRRKSVGNKRAKLIKFLLAQETDRSTYDVLKQCLQDTLTRSSGTFPLSVRLPQDLYRAYGINSGRVIVDRKGNVFERNADGTRGKQLTSVYVGFME